MKRTVIALFFVGLLFEFAAFFGDQAANIPFVMKFVAPRYTQAQAGVQALSTKKTLETTDPGFAVISEILLALMHELNDPKDVAKISIQKFSLGNAGLRFNSNRAREVIPINVTLSDGQILEWDLASLTTRVDALQEKNLFGYALVVFLIGAVIQCIGFVVAFRESKRPNRQNSGK